MSTIRKKASRTKRKRKLSVKKAPGAPKRFKSSYIHFFMHVHDKVKKALPPEEATAPLISKRASQMWKNLSDSERGYWDDLAENEKKSYLEQKKAYKGPWKIPNKRAKKDPSAPKRNPSAFLLFASTRRNVLQDTFPHLDNTAISRILGHEWRTMAPEIKSQFVNRELAERALYKEKMEQWKRGKELKDGIASLLSSPTEITDTFRENEEEEQQGSFDNSHVDALLKTLTKKDAFPSQEDLATLSRTGSSNVKDKTKIFSEEKEIEPHRPLDFLRDLSHSHQQVSNDLNSEVDTSRDLQFQERHPNVLHPSQPVNNSNSTTPSHYYDLEGSYHRLEKTSMLYENNSNRDFDANLRHREMRSINHLDNLVPRSHPSSLMSGHVTNELPPAEVLFRRCSDLQPLYKSGRNRMPDHQNRDRRQSCCEMSSQQHLFQSFEHFENAFSSCNDNLEGSFRWLEMRFGLVDDSTNSNRRES